MKFIVTEIQTAADGNVALLNHVLDTRNAADSTYYQILSYAAISELPCHGAAMYTSEGGFIMSHAYQRYPEPEPTPEPEPEPEETT